MFAYTFRTLNFGFVDYDYSTRWSTLRNNGIKHSAFYLIAFVLRTVWREYVQKCRIVRPNSSANSVFVHRILRIRFITDLLQVTMCGRFIKFIRFMLTCSPKVSFLSGKNLYVLVSQFAAWQYIIANDKTLSLRYNFFTLVMRLLCRRPVTAANTNWLQIYMYMAVLNSNATRKYVWNQVRWHVVHTTLSWFYFRCIHSAAKSLWPHYEIFFFRRCSWIIPPKVCL